MVNYTICNCKKVTFFDVEDALNRFDKFEDVEKKLRGSSANHPLFNGLWRLSR